MWGMAKRLPIPVAWVGWSIAATLGLDGTGGDGADLWAIIISTTERSLTGGRALTMPFEYVLIRAMSVKAATDDNPSCCCCLGMVIKRWPTWTSSHRFSKDDSIMGWPPSPRPRFFSTDRFSFAAGPRRAGRLRWALSDWAVRMLGEDFLLPQVT